MKRLCTSLPKDSIGSRWAVILFWGALWGVAEATVGWLMHVLHLPTVNLVMFPLALLAMGAAVALTGHAGSAMRVAAVAAAVKLTDLLVLGGAPAYWVLNPAVHMLLEGAGMAVLFQVTLFSRERGSLLENCLAALGVMCMVLALFTTWAWTMSEWVTPNPQFDASLAFPEMLASMFQLLYETAFAVAAVKLTAAWRRGGVRGLSLAGSPPLALALGCVAVAVTMLTF